MIRYKYHLFYYHLFYPYDYVNVIILSLINYNESLKMTKLLKLN